MTLVCGYCPDTGPTWSGGTANILRKSWIQWVSTASNPLWKSPDSPDFNRDHHDSAENSILTGLLPSLK